MERDRADGRIVVGVDGSESSTHALQWAAQEAVSRGVGLDVLHAWGTQRSWYPDGGDVDPAPSELRGSAILDDAVATIAGLARVPPVVRAVPAGDDAATALLRAAADAALLVVGSRGHGGFVGLLIGSVSQRCVDHAPCPVAVIASNWDGTTRGRVVVGVDDSDASYSALRWAIAEAARRDAQLDVVNAYGFHQYFAPYGPSAPIDPSQMHKCSQTLLEEMVAGIVGGSAVQPRTVELIPVSTGAVPALLESAKGADLLVVGSRGRGNIRGLLLGSVSQNCVRHTPCPIVVVRPRPRD